MMIHMLLITIRSLHALLSANELKKIVRYAFLRCQAKNFAGFFRL